MWTGTFLLIAITALYAGYNLLVKVSSTCVPESATSTVLATICLQLAALAASSTFVLVLLARGGQVLKLSPTAYAWAAGAGLCVGFAEIGYFYLFRGIGRTARTSCSPSAWHATQKSAATVTAPARVISGRCSIWQAVHRRASILSR